MHYHVEWLYCRKTGLFLNVKSSAYKARHNNALATGSLIQQHIYNNSDCIVSQSRGYKTQSYTAFYGDIAM